MFSPKFILLSLSGAGITAGGLAAWRLTKRTGPVTMSAIPETLAHQNSDSNLGESSPNSVSSEPVESLKSKEENASDSDNQEVSRQVTEGLSNPNSDHSLEKPSLDNVSSESEKQNRQENHGIMSASNDSMDQVNQKCGNDIWGTNVGMDDYPKTNTKGKNYSEYTECAIKVEEEVARKYQSL